MKNRFAAYTLVLLRKDNKILLIKRADNASFAPGYYSLAGGLVEKNETFRQALARELCEEIGITVNQNDLHFVHMFHRRGTEHEIVATIFECTTWQGEPFNKEPNKHSEIVWIDPEQLPAPMLPAHKNALQAIMEKKYYSEQS